jgi:hypothetical protein
MDKLTSYDICTKYGCLSRIFTLITYFIMLFVVILLLNIKNFWLYYIFYSSYTTLDYITCCDYSINSLFFLECNYS